MTPEQVAAQLKFEESLKPGDKVRLHRTRFDGRSSFRATVIRVNRMSVRVRRYSGEELTLPRITQLRSLRKPYFDGWSEANGVFPIKGGGQ